MTDVVMDGNESIRLCAQAGRDPEELITKFILEDFAATLVDMGLSEKEISLQGLWALPAIWLVTILTNINCEG